MKTGCMLAICLALLMTLALWGRASAAGPPEDDPDQDNGRRVGLVSTEAKCLVIQGGVPDSASAIVRLQWKGQIERAFLALSASGSEGGHSVYVNGRRVGSVPVRPGGPLCRPELPASVLGPIDLVSIPIELVRQDENVITLTNDANVNDGWTAAGLRIEIHGVLSGPPAAALEAIPQALPELAVAAAKPLSGTLLLTSTYELARGQEISQLVSYQIPASYTGIVSVPLLIGIHGMGGSGQGTRDFLASEANNRGWLLAAPEMHGSYYVNIGSYALAWPGAQHDIIDTIEHMMSGYKVDPSHIYITGGSMGGQTTAVMAAKYPDVFAAVVPWKPVTDLTAWYYELGAPGDPYIIRPRIGNETGGTPVNKPFEYERRSPIVMPQNSRLVPFKMWHDVDDQLVPIHHSRDLRSAIDSWNPMIPVTLIEIPPAANDCPPDGGWEPEHCYNPPATDILDFLDDFTFSTGPPLSLTICTDESKPYYWLNLAQTGGDHWSRMQASYDLTSATVTATISDTHPLTVAFNLGPMSIRGRVMERAGMGLPATTYLVNGGGENRLEDYTSGYLTTTLNATGQFTLTISAVEASLLANPPVVSVAGWQTTASTVTATFKDRLDNPVPDGTIVQFSTSEGMFQDASSTYTATVKIGARGRVTATLILTPSAELAHVIASVGSVTASTSIDVLHPAVDVLVTTDQALVHSGQLVMYTYEITNTGDITLTDVTVVDDNGTPGDGNDDVTACEYAILAVEETRSCSRSAVVTRTTIATAIVTGCDPLGNDVSQRDSTTVIVGKIYLPMVVKSVVIDSRRVRQAFLAGGNTRKRGSGMSNEWLWWDGSRGIFRRRR
jgi:pimeloyl-ACP methyl ester carboxylesterase